MSTGTGIEWTDATWSPVVGCTPVSPGCKNCYAATFAARGLHEKYVGLTVRRKGENGRTRAVFNGTVRCLPDQLTIPLQWRKPRRIFVCSMSDLFHKSVPFEFIDRVFAVMALCPQHTFQVLTKRPERMAEYLLARREVTWLSPGEAGSRRQMESCQQIVQINSNGMLYKGSGGRRLERAYSSCDEWPLPNVWLGTSVEDQTNADTRIPHLLRCPAAVRFLSCEPLLGPLDLSAFFGGPYVGLPGDKVHENYNFGINWVIVGGESGAARPCDVAWIRSIVKQCKAASVPVFVKQLGAWPVEMPMRWIPDDGGEAVSRWYKPSDRKGGDPSEWPEDLRVREMPEVAHG